MNAVSQPEPEPEAERAYGQCEENEDCCFSQLGVGCFYPRLNILGVKLCIAPTDAYVILSLFHAKRNAAASAMNEITCHVLRVRGHDFTRMKHPDSNADIPYV